MKKILSIFGTRAAVVGMFLILQIVVVVAFLFYVSESFVLFYWTFLVFGFCAVIYVINRDGDPAFKVVWVMAMLVVPVFGVSMYLMFGKHNKGTRKERERRDVIRKKAEAEALWFLCNTDELPAHIRLQSDYLAKSCGMPAYGDTDVEYCPVGEIAFTSILEELKRAERYIFLEFFIIKYGVLWDSVLAVLEEKAAQGLDVRLIYDDWGCILHLPTDFESMMEAKGIKCHSFERFRPRLSGSLNNRDHRKIVVIDGKVAMTGGVNIADEYINEKERFGHWRDSSVILRGPAAYGFALLFLAMWDVLMDSKEDYRAFLPESTGLRAFEGFVQPYADSPEDDEEVGENVYMNMISKAKRYVYITTPYLVIDSKMTAVLCNAARCGVDVRIVTPGIPDKNYVYQVTRSYYGALVKAGVRIYEYTPGFLHSKTFVCDGEIAVCGTINLDFRSLYLHHECAVLMYKSHAVTQMYEDFCDILSKSREVTRDTINAQSLALRLVQSVLRVFSPML